MILDEFLEEKKKDLKAIGQITLQCKVKPNAKTSCLRDLLLDQKTLVIWVNKPPLDGKANKELIFLLSKFFSVAKSNVEIKLGKTFGMKVVKITNYK